MSDMTMPVFAFCLLMCTILFSASSVAGDAAMPPPGTILPDGSVYAGLSPDGNVPMYTTPGDTGIGMSICGNTPGVYCNGTGYTDATAGEQMGLAAQFCESLVVHGHDDWYLPTREELDVLYVNRAAIGGFDAAAVRDRLVAPLVSGTYYMSSTIYNNSGAWLQRFSDGKQVGFSKHGGDRVRCVRK